MALLPIALAGLLLQGQAFAQVISVNRTAGQVEVGTCEGLKKNAELGIDINIFVTENLRCTETITLPDGVDVSIASEEGAVENRFIALAENFVVQNASSITLLVNPEGSSLSLTGLNFANEVGSSGAQGVARAVWNAGTLDVSGCTFSGLNFASAQDGGAIYSTSEPGTSGDGGFVSVRNSTFVGNIAENHGGAIAAWGQGTVEVSNCSFLGNEAVGVGSYRRAGSGGALYASPGVIVTVLNSTFEGCLGRYGGAAVFSCGGEIQDSIFENNEATGLFGAVVNGDLSDEERAAASLALGTGDGSQNYTCPPLSVTGSLFDGNMAVTGVGGAIAAVDSSLSVFNSSILDTSGGAIYFGTSDGSGRDQLDVDLVIFDYNEGSDSNPSFVGSALLLEKTGSSASNTTGDLEAIEVVTSSSSTSSAAAVAQSASAAGAPGVIGVVRDIYCFQNNPYQCEVYLGSMHEAGSDDVGGGISVQLAGIIRCNSCKGEAFTGIGSAEGAPTPSPFAVDDDDGLSQMGQERAQGGTPSPGAVGISSSDGAVDDVVSEPELLGATGDMRWVVLGLIVSIGGALLVCMCMMTVCRSKEKRRFIRRESRRQRPVSGVGLDGVGDDEESRPRSSAVVAPGVSPSNHGNREGVPVAAGDDGKEQSAFFMSGTSAMAKVNAPSAATKSSSQQQPADGAGSSRARTSSRRPSGRVEVGAEVGDNSGASRSTSPSAPATAGADVFPSGAISRRPSANGSSSRASSRRLSGLVGDGGGGGAGGRDTRRETTDSAIAVVNIPTPASSQLQARELARQRSIEMSRKDWVAPPLVSAWGDENTVGGKGHVALSQRSTPTRKGFSALPGGSSDHSPEEAHFKTKGRSRQRGRGAAAGSHLDWVHADQSPPLGSPSYSGSSANPFTTLRDGSVDNSPDQRKTKIASRTRSRSREGKASASRPSLAQGDISQSSRSLNLSGSPGDAEDAPDLGSWSRPEMSRDSSRSSSWRPSGSTTVSTGGRSSGSIERSNSQRRRGSASVLPAGTPARAGSGEIGGDGGFGAKSYGKRGTKLKPRPPGKPQVKGRSREASVERNSGRTVARSVKTPAGGARLPIKTSSPPRSGADTSKERGKTDRSAAAAAAAAAAATVDRLDAAGNSGHGGSGLTRELSDSRVISSENNPFYSHG